MPEEWREEPASRMQKHKLRFLGVEVPRCLTKGEAADILDSYEGTVEELAWKKSKRRARLWEQEADRKCQERDRFDESIRVEIWHSHMEDFAGLADLKQVSRARIRGVLSELDSLYPGWEERADKNNLIERQLRLKYPQLLKKSSPYYSPRPQPGDSATFSEVVGFGCAMVVISVLSIGLIVSVVVWGGKSALGP